MNQVSTTAVRVGKECLIVKSVILKYLSRRTVGDSAQRAQAAYDLIDLYGSFAKGDTSKLDALRKEGRIEWKASSRYTATPPEYCGKGSGPSFSR
jgi:hypothetical protein